MGVLGPGRPSLYFGPTLLEWASLPGTVPSATAPGPSEPCTPHSVSFGYDIHLDRWVFGANGDVDDFDAPSDGSTLRLPSPVIDGNSTPDGRSDWTVAADGGIFTFGDAGSPVQRVVL